MRAVKIVLSSAVFVILGIAVVVGLGLYNGKPAEPTKVPATTTSSVRTTTTSTLPVHESVFESDVPEQWGLGVPFPELDSEIAQEDLRPVVTKNLKNNLITSKTVNINEHRFIEAWAECTPGERASDFCNIYIGLFDNDAFTLIQKQPLPHHLRAWSSYGVDFENEHMSLYDVNADGRKDLIITYQVTDYPRPAVGSRFEHRIAIFDTYTLQLMWSGTLADGSGADTEKMCYTSLRYFDNGCTNKPNILAVDTCSDMHYCIDNPDAECTKYPVTSPRRLYVWSQSVGAFTQLSPIPETCPDQY